jgi:flagellar hook assembly protein FlgD
MGYDYRGASSNPVGSVAPIGGPSYDIADTARAYLGRVPASKVILAVPYYGRAWSTDSAALHARNISGTKYGASVTVVYGTARDYAVQHGRRWDSVEGVAWTSYRRKNCTTAYGCVTPWREIYYDDAQALGLKYDVINRYNLRGAGIWALGYDGTRPELHAVLQAKFITDTVPPKISSATISTPIISPNGDRRLDTTTVKVAVTGHISFGWQVQPIVAGVAGAVLRSGSLASKNVSFTWDGRNNAGRLVSDGTYRILVWAADASNNRAAAGWVVTVDRRAAAMTLAAAPVFISPNGDGHSDSTKLSMRTDEALSGTARLLNKSGASVRKWTFTSATTASWTWNGHDAAGNIVPDGRYTLRVGGYDRAGNPSVRQMIVRVDRTTQSVAWSRSAFTPRVGQTDRVTFALRRPARVTLSIYQGNVLIRRVWAKDFAAGRHGWTWNGKSTSGRFVKPGTYRAVVDAASWIGWSTFSRTVVVKAP